MHIHGDDKYRQWLQIKEASISPDSNGLKSHQFDINPIVCTSDWYQIAVLVVSYGISNTYVLEIP